VELKLNHEDHIRVVTDRGNNFIDVSGMPYEHGIRVSAYPHFHYIEVREKAGQIATFYFRNKGVKKDTDLGWWQDADVVWSKNEVYHK